MSIEQLQAKVETLRAEVADRVALVEATKANRDVELSQRDAAIVDAEIAAQSLHDCACEAEYEAQRLDCKAARILEIASRQAADLVANANDLRELAAAVPDGSFQINLARAGKQCCEEKWREELARVQDGKLRRKLAELERLEARLASRTSEARPRGTGLLEKEAQETRGQRAAKQYRLTLTQLREVREKGLFTNPRYKGPPEWAFMKAIEDLKKMIAPDRAREIEEEVVNV